MGDAMKLYEVYLLATPLLFGAGALLRGPVSWHGVPKLIKVMAWVFSGSMFLAVATGIPNATIGLAQGPTALRTWLVSGAFIVQAGYFLSVTSSSLPFPSGSPKGEPKHGGEKEHQGTQ